MVKTLDREEDGHCGPLSPSGVTGFPSNIALLWWLPLNRSPRFGRFQNGKWLGSPDHGRSRRCFFSSFSRRSIVVASGALFSLVFVDLAHQAQGSRASGNSSQQSQGVPTLKWEGWMGDSKQVFLGVSLENHLPVVFRVSSNSSHRGDQTTSISNFGIFQPRLVDSTACLGFTALRAFPLRGESRAVEVLSKWLVVSRLLQGHQPFQIPFAGLPIHHAKSLTLNWSRG